MDNSFEVEKILRRRAMKSKIQYFVKWANYENSDNSWVNESDMNCEDLLEQFLCHTIIGNHLFFRLSYF